MLSKLGFLDGSDACNEECVSGMFSAADTNGDGKVCAAIWPRESLHSTMRMGPYIVL
jgi:hypothetical protein